MVDGSTMAILGKDKWPKTLVNHTKKEEEIISSEQNKIVAVNVNEFSSEIFSDKLLHFSQYSKIVRLVARLLRMSPNTRKIFNKQSVHIRFEEYRYAEETLIKLLQKVFTKHNFTTRKK